MNGQTGSGTSTQSHSHQRAHESRRGLHSRWLASYSNAKSTNSNYGRASEASSSEQEPGCLAARSSCLRCGCSGCLPVLSCRQGGASWHVAAAQLLHKRSRKRSRKWQASSARATMPRLGNSALRRQVFASDASPTVHRSTVVDWGTEGGGLASYVGV